MGGIPASFAAVRSRSWDAVTLLTLYLVLLFGMPSALIFSPLGSAGTPATVLGIVALMLWIWERLNRSETVSVGRQPVRFAMGCFVALVGISHVLAMVRPINAEEISTADAALLSLAGWLGIILTANDLIPSKDRITVLFQRISFAAGALATFGIVQFVARQSLTDYYLLIPGLKANVPLYPILDRSGFPRPSGTALHPIEFGTTLTVILPIALTCAFQSTARSWLRRWYPVIVIGLAIPLSVSRSSLIGAAVGLAILIPTWPRATRRTAYVAIGGLGTVVFLTVPGMLGTLRNLFTGIGGDSSAQSRTGSYDIAFTFVRRSPLFGRGLGTFLPRYRIFDNQYLGLLVEIGILGLIACLALVVTAIVTARRARKWSTDPTTRQQAQALVAATAVAACSMALFDAFSFPMFMGTTALILGASGALYRLVRETEPSVRPVRTRGARRLSPNVDLDISRSDSEEGSEPMTEQADSSRQHARE